MRLLHVCMRAAKAHALGPGRLSLHKGHVHMRTEGLKTQDSK